MQQFVTPSAAAAAAAAAVAGVGPNFVLFPPFLDQLHHASAAGAFQSPLQNMQSLLQKNTVSTNKEGRNVLFCEIIRDCFNSKFVNFSSN